MLFFKKNKKMFSNKKNFIMWAKSENFLIKSIIDLVTLNDYRFSCYFKLN